MFCRHCGQQLGPGARFCQACGQWATPQPVAPDPDRDPAMRFILPFGRTPLSIAAGYLGLACFLVPVAGPIALVVGILALSELKMKPEALGRGRAWFAVIVGGLDTLLLAVMLVVLLTEI